VKMDIPKPYSPIFHANKCFTNRCEENCSIGDMTSAMIGCTFYNYYKLLQYSQSVIIVAIM